MDENEILKRAIAAQENLRGLVPDEVVDAAVRALSTRLVEMESSHVAHKRRKLVTVLFADVSGSTAMQETMDAEEVGEVFDALWERLDEAILEFNGRIDKHIGDAVMALWGAEEAREDDAEAAIRAALAMQDAIREWRPEGMETPVALGIRIGINTGPVLLGDVGTTREFTAMGDTVNVASRIESAAPVGGILISHDTYQHVRGIFTVRAQPPLALKGKSEPIRSYVIEGARPRAFRLATRGVEGVETRMVGRQTELAHLQKALQTAAGGELQMVTVVGEAGIGKSRLLYEFEDWLARRPGDFGLFRGRADQQRQGVPFSLVRDLIFFRFEVADDDPRALAKLETGAGAVMGEAGAEHAHFIGHLIGLDVSHSPYVSGILEDTRQMRDRAFHALVQLFSSGAGKETPVVLLEDIHWADQGSLDLVDHLALRLHGGPMLVVALTRPTLYEHRPNWGKTGAGQSELVLRPLSARDSRELVKEVLQKVPEIPEVVAETISTNAEGNPFYVEELIKMLIDDGVIGVGDDEWHVTTERLSALKVPPTLTGVVQARLDRLSSAELKTLQRASVVGRTFWDEALVELATHAGAGPPTDPRAELVGRELTGVLDSVRERELVLRRPTTAFAGSTEYMFKHAFTRDVTYEGVLRRQRQRFHLQTAAWLAGKAEVGAHAATIARHFELAGSGQEAARWYAEAGRLAQASYANDEAVAHFRRALDSEGDRVGIWERLGEVLILQGHYDEALDAFRAMSAAAEKAGASTDLARAWTGISQVQHFQGEYRGSVASAERAEALMRSAGTTEDSHLARTLTVAGWALYRLGDYEEALTRAEQASAAATARADRREQAGSLNLMAAVNDALGRSARAARHLHEALALDRELGDRHGEGATLHNLGFSSYIQGDYTGALSRLQEALEIARAIGDRDIEAASLTYLGAAHAAMGMHRAAIEHLETAEAAHDESGDQSGISETCRFLAEVWLHLDEPGRALEFARRALAYGGENPEDVGHAWRVLGLVSIRLGRPISPDPAARGEEYGAAACFGISVESFAGAGLERDRALAVRDLARWELSDGDARKGAALWREARRVFGELDLTRLVAEMDEEIPPAPGVS